MKKTDNTTGFWAGGCRSFKSSLDEKEKEMIAPLMAELETTTAPSRKAELENQIKAIKDDSKAKRKNAKYGLF